jgi:hypothetical protein
MNYNMGVTKTINRTLKYDTDKPEIHTLMNINT